MSDEPYFPPASVPVRYVGMSKDDISYAEEFAMTDSLPSGETLVQTIEDYALKSIWHRAKNEIVIQWASTEEIVEETGLDYDSALRETHPSKIDPDGR